MQAAVTDLCIYGRSRGKASARGRVPGRVRLCFGTIAAGMLLAGCLGMNRHETARAIAAQAGLTATRFQGEAFVPCKPSPGFRPLWCIDSCLHRGRRFRLDHPDPPLAGSNAQQSGRAASCRSGPGPERGLYCRGPASRPGGRPAHGGLLNWPAFRPGSRGQRQCHARRAQGQGRRRDDPPDRVFRWRCRCGPGGNPAERRGQPANRCRQSGSCAPELVGQRQPPDRFAECRGRGGHDSRPAPAPFRWAGGHGGPCRRCGKLPDGCGCELPAASSSCRLQRPPTPMARWNAGPAF